MKCKDDSESYIVSKKIRGWWMDRVYDLSLINNTTTWTKSNDDVVIETEYISGMVKIAINIEGTGFCSFNNLKDFELFCSNKNVEHPITHDNLF